LEAYGAKEAESVVYRLHEKQQFSLNLGEHP